MCTGRRRKPSGTGSQTSWSVWQTLRRWGDFLEFSHVVLLKPSCLHRSADANRTGIHVGGISRLSGAGLFLNTRPAKSKVEPWQGADTGSRHSSRQAKKAEGPFELIAGRATQVGANAHAHENFRLDGAVLVLRTRGWGTSCDLTWDRPVGLGLGQRSNLPVRVRFENPHGLAAPFHSELSPGCRAEISTSTAAPAALAFSEG